MKLPYNLPPANEWPNKTKSPEAVRPTQGDAIKVTENIIHHTAESRKFFKIKGVSA